MVVYGFTGAAESDLAFSHNERLLETVFAEATALGAVPVLVCLTAGAQRYLAAVDDLNPWKGGGYGMFADIHRTHPTGQTQRLQDTPMREGIG